MLDGRTRPAGAAIGLLDNSPWQMSFGERAALEGVLAQLRPRLSVEIGTADGGSLAAIVHHGEEAHSFDLELPHELVARFPQVHFHPGDSRETLPRALAQFAAQGRNVDFVLVDGDHSADGVERDVENVLASPAVGDAIILLHDSSNELVREGLERVAYESHPRIVYVDLDFLPGYVMREEHAGEIWGGFGLIRVSSAAGTTARDGVRQGRYHSAAEMLRVARDQRFRSV